MQLGLLLVRRLMGGNEGGRLRGTSGRRRDVAPSPLQSNATAAAWSTADTAALQVQWMMGEQHGPLRSPLRASNPSCACQSGLAAALAIPVTRVVVVSVSPATGTASVALLPAPTDGSSGSGGPSVAALVATLQVR